MTNKPGFWIELKFCILIREFLQVLLAVHLRRLLLAMPVHSANLDKSNTFMGDSGLTALEKVDFISIIPYLAKWLETRGNQCGRVMKLENDYVWS